MEEILQLRDEHVRTVVPEIKALIRSQADITEEIQRTREQRLQEDENTIKELVIACLTRKQKLEEATKSLERKNEVYLQLKNYYDMTQEIHMSAVSEKGRMEEKLNVLKSNKPNVQDQKLLELGKRKLKYYNILTGIKWNYEAVDHSIKGCILHVTNGTDRIKHLNFENQKINTDIINSLWQEIFLSVKQDENSVDVNDENREPNIASQ